MYITNKQFLEQTKEVQDNLINWWQPCDSDLIGESHDYCLVGELMMPNRPNAFKEKYIYSNKYVPLFNESQLRRYIEDKLNGKVQCVWSEFENKYSYTISVCIKGQQWWRKTNETDLLQAYWKIVIDISDN